MKRLITSRRRALLIGFLTGLVVSGCGTGELSVFESSRSPRGDHEIVLHLAESSIPSGPYHIFVDVRVDGGASMRLIETTIANDGVPPTRRDIALRWVDNTHALLCLHESDLADRGTRIIIASPPRAEQIERC
ncbi:MAG: hypothetical protein AAF384_02275 [Pseudomonadota bacterium]